MHRTIVVTLTAGAAVSLSGLLVARGTAGPPPAAPTFAKDVAPILYKHCTGCHRPGEIGPFSLLTYESARPHAADIRDEVRDGTMPPWNADPHVGTFANDRRLTPAEKDVIERWADAGAPRGDDTDLPPAPSYTTGWSIGAPDAVVSMPEAFDVPAQGTIAYQYFEIPTNFTEDRWIQAMEVRPGARRVVHHVLVYCREPAGGTPRPRVLVPRIDLAPPQAIAAPNPNATGTSAPRHALGTLIATTAPGTNAMVFPAGAALLIRAGAVLTFQVHYTASGEAASDRSSIGFVFAKSPPADEIRSGNFVNGRFVIPAGAASYQVDSEVGFSDDVHVWGLFPHTHLRGTRWEYHLVYPDGRSEAILSVPRYDFNWQTYYMFATPLAVPKGSKIQASAWYDNSAANRSNPDPTVDVRWGDQTWEEMQYTAITYTVDSPHSGAPAQSASGGGQ